MISRHGFSLSKWGLPHGVKNDFEDNHADEESAAKSHAPQLRRRGPHAAPGLFYLSDFFNICH